MKKITAVLCAAMVLLPVGCGKGNTSNMQIDYGTSSGCLQKGLLQFFAAAPSALLSSADHPAGFFDYLQF